MEDETASSYYRSLPERNSLISKMNLLQKIDYWKLVSILKLLNGRRYKREAKTLLKIGNKQASRGGVRVRYEIANGIASFDISPDQGQSYLNYLRGNVVTDSEDQLGHVVNAIATIEARIKTKNYLTF